jgi:CPA2 family monovalent cation:H+ antiporter-2|tara:strand:+ start:75965 stop:78358 length:2394 start_codon:yes stop_codon:yes gene_type:complete
MVLVLAASAGGSLVSDLGIVVFAAAMVLLLFQWLRLPAIFGYLLAGILLGGKIGLPSVVQEFGSIQELSELGIIFLLFFIGLEFDLRRLKSLLWPTLLALMLQTIGMIYLAHVVASLFGWSSIEALFLGSLLAISSSMVTVKVLNDQNRMKMPHAQLAIGILVMEDILAVVLLVILTGTAVTRQFEWDAAWLVIFFMGVFVFAVFTVGRILAPRVLKFLCRDDDNHEVSTIFSLGLVLGVSVLALKLNFSPALGAFLAGAMLAQTPHSKDLEHVHRPLHDLFSAVFFVTVGMLMDPLAIIANIGWVLLVALLVVFGKITSCWLGLFLSGQPARTSFRAGVAKAQIGEFSFIIASLGLSLVGDDPAMREMASLAYGVAFVTILLTPFLTKHSGDVADFIALKIPARLQRFGTFYHELIEHSVTQLGRNRILQEIRQPLSRIFAYFLLQNAVLIGGFFTARHVSSTELIAESYAGVVLLCLWLFIALCLAPFLFTIIASLNQLLYRMTEALFETRDEEPILQGRMRNLFNGLSLVLSSFVVGGFYVSFASPWLPAKSLLAIVVVFIVVIGVVFWRRLARFNQSLELLFMDSFREHVQVAEEHHREAVMSEIREKYPWEVEVREIVVPAHSDLAGCRIRDTRIRDDSGATVIGLSRDDLEVFDPSPDTPLFPGDVLILLGDSEQLLAAEGIVRQTRDTGGESEEKPEIDFRPLYVLPNSSVDGNTLAGVDVRKRFGVSVIGLQRGEERITSPRPDLMLRGGDVVYVVGRSKGLEGFAEYCSETGRPEEEQAITDVAGKTQ